MRHACRQRESRRQQPDRATVAGVRPLRPSEAQARSRSRGCSRADTLQSLKCGTEDSSRSSSCPYREPREESGENRIDRSRLPGAPPEDRQTASPVRPRQLRIPWQSSRYSTCYAVRPAASAPSDYQAAFQHHAQRDRCRKRNQRVLSASPDSSETDPLSPTAGAAQRRRGFWISYGPPNAFYAKRSFRQYNLKARFFCRPRSMTAHNSPAKAQNTWTWEWRSW